MVIVFPSGSSMIIVGENCSRMTLTTNAWWYMETSTMKIIMRVVLQLGYSLYLAAWGLVNLPSDHICSPSAGNCVGVWIKGEGVSGLRVRAGMQTAKTSPLFKNITGKYLRTSLSYIQAAPRKKSSYRCDDEGKGMNMWCRQRSMNNELRTHEGGVKSFHLQVTLLWDMWMQYVDSWYAIKLAGFCDESRCLRPRSEGAIEGKFRHIFAISRVRIWHKLPMHVHNSHRAHVMFLFRPAHFWLKFFWSLCRPYKLVLSLSSVCNAVICAVV
jgi:hypothetical protein